MLFSLFTDIAYRDYDNLPANHELRNREDRELLKLVMLIGTFSSLSLLSERRIELESSNLSLAMLREASLPVGFFLIWQSLTPKFLRAQA